MRQENLAEVPPFYEVGTHSHHTLPLSVTLTVFSCLGTGVRTGKHGDETADAGVVGDVAGSSNRAVGAVAVKPVAIVAKWGRTWHENSITRGNV